MDQLIDESRTGLVARDRNPQTLARHIIRLADDPELRATLGANGRRIAQNYSLDKMIDALEALYQQRTPRTLRAQVETRIANSAKSHTAGAA